MRTFRSHERSESSAYEDFCIYVLLVYPENPIHRPPAPTPSHNAIDTTPTIVHGDGD